MKNRQFLNYFVLLTLLFLCLTASFSAQTPPEANAAEKPVLPDLILDTIDGQKWSLHDNRGNIIVMNFWATWCEPCRTETPILVKLADEYEKHGLKVAGIALDEDGLELVKKFIAEYKIDYPILIPEPGSPLAKVENTPTTLLIDAEGRLAKKYVGAVPENVLRKDIEKLTKVPESKQNDAAAR